MGDEDLYTLEEVIADLDLLRQHERELTAKVTALIESGNLPAQMATVIKLARDAFRDDAARFLIEPHWELYDKAPIDVARTPEGAQEVETLLGKIIHGICV
jgi:putative toxin-antitoxin system antitoxin component (TIGR02293 family)